MGAATLSSCSSRAKGKGMSAVDMELAQLPKGVYQDYDSLHKVGDKYTIYQITDIADSTYIRAEDVDGAMGWLRVAVSRDFHTLSQNDKMLYGMALCNLGYLWLSYKNNPEQAYNLLMQALQLVPEVDKGDNLKGACEGNLGQFYMYYHDLSRALTWYKKSFATHLHNPDHTKVNYPYVDLVHFAWLNDSLAAVRRESASYAKENHTVGFLGQYGMLLNKAAGAYLDKDYAQAASLLEQANGAMELQGDEARYRAVNRLITAQTAIKAGMTELAAAALDSARVLTRCPELTDLADKYFNIMADYYRKQGLTAKAYECEFRAMKYRDSLFNAQRYGAIRDIETAWDAAQFDAKPGRPGRARLRTAPAPPRRR